MTAARVGGALRPTFAPAVAFSEGAIRSLDALRLADGRVLVLYAAGDRAELRSVVVSPSLP
jgi:hypothetical protein